MPKPIRDLLVIFALWLVLLVLMYRYDFSGQNILFSSLIFLFGTIVFFILKKYVRNKYLADLLFIFFFGLMSGLYLKYALGRDIVDFIVAYAGAATYLLAKLVLESRKINNG